MLSSSEKIQLIDKIPLITLNPARLSPPEEGLLHQFLLFDEQRPKEAKIKVFKPNHDYVFNDTLVRFTHTLVRHTIRLPEIEHKEYRYTVYDANTGFIDKGSFGYVYRVSGKIKHLPVENKAAYFSVPLQDKNKRRVIKKQTLSGNPAKQEDSIKRMKKESAITQLAPHTKASKMTFQQTNGNKLSSYIVMKEFQGMTLEKILKNKSQLSIEKRVTLSINLMRALEEQVHAPHIIHRDIKPENIFVDPDTLTVNIFDFGLSCAKEENIICGTPYWIAPETVAVNQTNKKSDVYSMGRILRTLWDDQVIDEEDRFYLISNDILIKRKEEYYYPHLSRPTVLPDFIRKMLKIYFKTHATIRIKFPQDIAALLDQLTDAVPNERASLKDVIRQFEIMQLQPETNAAKMQAIMAAKILRSELIALRFSNMPFHFKLNRLLSRVYEALLQIEDNEAIIQAFTQALEIEAFMQCTTKEAIKNEAKKIADTMQQTLQKREGLCSVILSEKKVASKKDGAIDPQLVNHIALFKKKPIFDLDNMKALNEKFEQYTEKKPRAASLHPSYAKTIAAAAMAFAMSGLVGGISLGLVISLIGLLPSAGASMASLPLLFAVFGTLGFMTGALIGLCAGIMNCCLQYHLAEAGIKQPETRTSFLKKHSLFTLSASQPSVGPPSYFRAESTGMSDQLCKLL